MSIKICPHCKETKPLELFFRNRANKDGLSYYCKSCDSARNSLLGKKRRALKKGSAPKVEKEEISVLRRHEVKLLEGQARAYVKLTCANPTCHGTQIIRYAKSVEEEDHYIGECEFCGRVVEIRFSGSN